MIEPLRKSLISTRAANPKRQTGGNPWFTVVLEEERRTQSAADIGGAGYSSDAMAIRICQFVGRGIRLLDLYPRWTTVASHCADASATW
jgi:hypothetical protein